MTGSMKLLQQAAGVRAALARRQVEDRGVQRQDRSERLSSRAIATRSSRRSTTSTSVTPRGSGTR
jgi:hypothetical protein